MKQFRKFQLEQVLEYFCIRALTSYYMTIQVHLKEIICCCNQVQIKYQHFSHCWILDCKFPEISEETTWKNYPNCLKCLMGITKHLCTRQIVRSNKLDSLLRRFSYTRRLPELTRKPAGAISIMILINPPPHYHHQKKCLKLQTCYCQL